MSARLRGLSSALIDLVLPPRCAACDALLHQASAIFCDLCAESLLENDAPCRRCALPLSVSSCVDCRVGQPPYSGARAPLLHGGQLAEALYRLKYRDAAHVSRALAPLLAAELIELEDLIDVIVPVPLHPRRLRQRGYNQSALLARDAAKRGQVDCGALWRTRDTSPQARLSRRARLANLRGAFQADPRRIKGRRVLLIDDVMTTGATVSACSLALRAAGASDVLVLTLARAVP